MILDIINGACAGLAISGCLILASKRGKDSTFGWRVYTIAAILGIIYFVITANVPQIIIWSSFLLGDVMALRRKWIEKHPWREI